MNTLKNKQGFIQLKTILTHSYVADSKKIFIQDNDCSIIKTTGYTDNLQNRNTNKFGQICVLEIICTTAALVLVPGRPISIIMIVFYFNRC